MKNNGFTLIELLISIAIIGILSSIALPSYQEYMRASKRTDAMTASLSLLLAQVDFRGNCALYAKTLGGSSNNCTSQTIKHSDTSPEGYYKLTLSGVSGNSFKITATPQGSQASDTTCKPMTITVNTTNPDGLKEPSACWN